MHEGQHGMSVKPARYVDEDRQPAGVIAGNERVRQTAQGHDPTVNHIEAERHRTRQERRSVQVRKAVSIDWAGLLACCSPYEACEE